MKVSVTQEIIDSSARQSPYNCAIAKAIRECLGDASIHLSVCNTHVKIGRLVFRLPYEAQVFICAFDNGRETKPFEFELDSMLPTYTSFQTVLQFENGPITFFMHYFNQSSNPSAWTKQYLKPYRNPELDPVASL